MSMSPSPAREGVDVVTPARCDVRALPELQLTAPAPPEPPRLGAAPLVPALSQPEHAPMLLPVETDIYILPDGRVIVADLPAELAARLPQLGQVEPCEITNHDHSDPAT